MPYTSYTCQITTTPTLMRTHLAPIMLCRNYKQLSGRRHRMPEPRAPILVGWPARLSLPLQFVILYRLNITHYLSQAEMFCAAPMQSNPPANARNTINSKAIFCGKKKYELMKGNPQPTPTFSRDLFFFAMAAALDGYEPLNLHHGGDVCYALRKYAPGGNRHSKGRSSREVKDEVFNSARLRRTMQEVRTTRCMLQDCGLPRHCYAMLSVTHTSLCILYDINLV